MDLEHLATFTVKLDPILELGGTHWGRRRVINIVGGSFEGPRFSGVVLPGGADWQVVELFAFIHDSQPAEVMARLARGEPVDPSEYYFRLFCRFETGDERYLWLNRTLAVGKAGRLPDAVRYDAYTLT